MLTSISPLGEGARNNRWPVTAGAYLVASVLAGGAVGLILGSVGRLVRAISHPSSTVLGVVVVAACAFAAGLDFAAGRARAGPVRIPTVRRQVNEDWLNRYRGWVYGAGFGLQLGVGVVTIVTTSTVYLVLLIEVLIGKVLLAALIGAVFGLVRAAPILIVGQVRTGAQLRLLHGRIASWAGPADRAAVGIVAVAATGSLVATVSR